MGMDLGQNDRNLALSLSLTLALTQPQPRADLYGSFPEKSARKEKSEKR